MIWQVSPETRFDLTHRAVIMGIVNVTPDSFSDGGRFPDVEAAVAYGVAQWQAGAEILDIGGESTRPGAAAVGPQEEMDRVLPVISALRQAVPDARISIDTMKAEVAAAALTAGAVIINDVTGFTHPAMVEVAARSTCGLVVMHMQGTPRTMQSAPHYDDVVAEVREFLAEQLATLERAAIPRDRVVLDPGIGFGKSLEHNLALLRHLDQLSPRDRPLLLGVSRKSFIGAVLGSTDLADRHWPTVALTSLARERGARILRVHDVAANTQALRMTEAILGPATRGQPE